MFPPISHTDTYADTHTHNKIHTVKVVSPFLKIKIVGKSSVQEYSMSKIKELKFALKFLINQVLIFYSYFRAWARKDKTRTTLPVYPSPLSQAETTLGRKAKEPPRPPAHQPSSQGSQELVKGGKVTLLSVRYAMGTSRILSSSGTTCSGYTRYCKQRRKHFSSTCIIPG